MVSASALRDFGRDSNQVGFSFFLVGFNNVSSVNITGWWLTYPSEKYDFVSWDYELPN